MPVFPDSMIERMHRSGRQLVLAITGGGSRAIADLLTVPGGSKLVLEAIVPYAPAAIDTWLGGAPDQYCSNRTARAMAMAAFHRARHLAPDVDPHILIGIGCTASLASNRPKRGPHRVHVAWQSAERTVVESMEPKQIARGRIGEEQLAAEMVLKAIAEAVGVEAEFPQATRHQVATDAGETPWMPGEWCLAFGEEIVRHEQTAPLEWTELLIGARDQILIQQVVPPNLGLATRVQPSAIVFPGAFNPFHAGHRRMAEIAADRIHGPLWFELSVANVDKPPLDYIEIADRLHGMVDIPVVLTQAAQFTDKAALFPGATFVVGVDTLERIADLTYYGGKTTARDAAIGAIAAQGCRFLVFGRKVNGSFRLLDDVELPRSLRALCEGVCQIDFREDISSTELRSMAR
ncbi:MAG: hypothetical protein JW829_01490 [Pirellulales bacterium]|nr:hypothetical protein [Pirellulales bacterium]